MLSIEIAIGFTFHCVGSRHIAIAPTISMNLIGYYYLVAKKETERIEENSLFDEKNLIFFFLKEDFCKVLTPSMRKKNQSSFSTPN